MKKLMVLLALAAATLSAQLTTVTPAENNKPLNNPYMGWGIWAGPRYFDGRSFTVDYNTKGFGDDAPLFQWLLIDWMWSDLEPQEGKYDWRDLDAVINYWAARKKQVYLRVWITDDPGWDNAPGNEVFPEWLAADGVKFREYISQGKFKKKETDYQDPSFERIYLPKARAFLSALAARYDKPDSPVIMWGAMGYGQWGEWHTLWSHYPWRDENAKHEVLAKIVHMYADVFKNHPVMISYCPDADSNQAKNLDDFLYRQALDTALQNHFALARHGFIDGLMLYDRLTMEKYWRRAAMLAEGNWSYTEVKDEGTHGSLQDNIDIFEEWHSNYGHFYVDADSYKRLVRDDAATFENALGAGGLGYRLVPTKVSWPEQIHAGDLLRIQWTWVNRNTGRLYVRFPLKVYLTDASGKEQFSVTDSSLTETSWIRGEEYPLDSLLMTSGKIPPGTYSLRFALVDQKGNPAIRLPIAGEDSEGRYQLGRIEIKPRRGAGSQ